MLRFQYFNFLFPVKRAEGLESDIVPEVEKKSQEGFVAEEVKQAKPDSKASVKTQVNCTAVYIAARLTPDFKALRLAGVWWASSLCQGQCFEITCQAQCIQIRRQTQHFKIFGLTPDFKKLHLAGIWRASGRCLAGARGNVLKSHVRRNAFKLGVRRNISKSSVTMSPACTKMYFKALESCPYKEALLENTGNNWTDSWSESRTSSNVTIIRLNSQLYPSGATYQ